MSRIENPKIKTYIYDLAISKLGECELFVQIFGKSFIINKLDINMTRVFTNEKRDDVAGYHSGSDSSVTICHSGKDGKLLSVDDIENDESIKCTLLHEAVHAILTRDKIECARLGIRYGTGILEQDKEGNEIGRGLNEGLTNWICYKAGLNPNSYEILTKFVKQLEIAVGPEAIMKIARGNLRVNLPEQLGMSYDEVIEILAIADQLYKDDERLTTLNRAIIQTKRRIEIHTILGQSDDLNEDEIKRLEDELNDLDESDKNIKSYFKHINSLPLDERLEILNEDLETQNVQKERVKKDVQSNRVKFESIIFEKYFKKEFEQLKQGPISEDAYKKFCDLSALVKPLDKEGEDAKDASIVFKKEVEHIKERFRNQMLEEARQSISNGTMTGKRFQELVNLFKYGNSNKENELFNEIGNIIDPINPTLIVGLYNSLSKNDDIEDIDKYSLLEITKIGEDREDDITQIICIKNNEIKDAYRTFDKHNIRAGEEIDNPQMFFNFTLTTNSDYSQIIKRFLELKEEVQAQNPSAMIHILDRTIIVNNNGEYQYYYIKGGDFHEMTPTKQIQLKNYFKPEEKNLGLIKYEKKNPLKEFWNKLKRKFLVNKKNNIIYEDISTNPNIADNTIEESDEEMSKFEASLRYSRFDEEYKERQSSNNFKTDSIKDKHIVTEDKEHDF